MSLFLMSAESNVELYMWQTIGFVQSKIRRWTLTLDSFHMEMSWLFILPTLNKAVLQNNSD